MWTTYLSQPLFLELNQVHLWFVDKKNHTNRISNYWDVLDDLEREKASKFRFVKDFNCSIIARGVLRILLGKYLNMNPKDIKLKLGEFGKPSLESLNNIEFNVSHSANAIVLAFVRNDKIGVDIEHTKRSIDVNSIAKQFFSKEEVNALFSLDRKDQKQAFY
ncbi:MAG: 4'-phosphopantetheinyl transferase superfamily protein, partial [Polaribacter sp.]